MLSFSVGADRCPQVASPTFSLSVGKLCLRVVRCPRHRRRHSALFAARPSLAVSSPLGAGRKGDGLASHSVPFLSLPLSLPNPGRPEFRQRFGHHTTPTVNSPAYARANSARPHRGWTPDLPPAATPPSEAQQGSSTIAAPRATISATGSAPVL